MITIKDLTYTYPGAERPTLMGINLEIEQGDFLAIVGNNGCGKSTLCKTLNGLIPHFIAGEYSGEVHVDEITVADNDIGTLAQEVGYVYQDFENQIVRPTVLDDASYACMNYAMKDYEERGRKALAQCGLSGKDEDYIWQLSGGQTHLLALAGAVSLQPEVLILDEPIAQLDPQHADRIYAVLKELNEKHGKTIIVIEHHTEYIAEYCKHVLLLKDGQVAWKLPTKEALCRVEELQSCNIYPPQVTLAAYALTRMGILPQGAALPVGIEDGKEAFQDLKYDNCVTKTPASDTTPETKWKQKEIVTYRDVCVSYRTVKGKPSEIFHHLNLTLHEGEKIALIGSNGAGKSTLMKLMTGLLKPAEGEVTVKGLSTREAKPEKLAEYVSLVYQNPEDMFIKESIREDISYAMRVRERQDWQERTQELLKRFRLEELCERDGRLLSGGQMRRASLAIGIALCPEILLLDEPTANLDIATRKEIMRTLQDMKEITRTVMIATHDMQLVSEWAERIVVLYQGKVIADGTRDEIFGNQEIIEKVGIRPPEIFTMGQTLQKTAYCYTVDEFVHGFGIMK